LSQTVNGATRIKNELITAVHNILVDSISKLIFTFPTIDTLVTTVMLICL